jgi:hypothetical protein
MPRSGKKRRRVFEAAGAAAALSLVLAAPTFAEDGPTDYSGLDSLSRFVGSSHSSVQEFAKLGGKLVDVRRGAFAGVGTGRTQRGLARGWNAAFDPWRNASAATKNSLPFKAAPGLFMASDIATSVIAPLTEYDLRGATAGAVNVAVSNTAANAGTVAIGAFGTGVGALIGSFVPVIGTAVGGIVGGAIGTVAGGYISYSAYDIYIKQHVVEAVEGGLAAIFDTAPLIKAMRAREERLRLQAALDLKPEWEKLHRIGEDFDMSSVELVPPPTIFYQPGTPGAGDVPPTIDSSDYLAGVHRLVIGELVLSITGGVVTGIAEFPGWGRTVATVRGILSRNRIEGTMTYLHTDDQSQCGYVVRETVPIVYIFNAETVTGEHRPGPVDVLSTYGPCGQGWAKMTEGFTYTSPWKVLE